MSFIIYFAVTRYDERIYMTEQENENPQICFVDMLDNINDLKNELDWSELDGIFNLKKQDAIEQLLSADIQMKMIICVLFHVPQYVLFKI